MFLTISIEVKSVELELTVILIQEINSKKGRPMLFFFLYYTILALPLSLLSDFVGIKAKPKAKPKKWKMQTELLPYRTRLGRERRPGEEFVYFFQ